MIYVLFGVVAVLLGYIGVMRLDVRSSRREFKEDREAMSLERTAWANERRDLNNRIQVPEAAPYMTPGTEAPPVQHVPYDDDEAFNKAREELADQWPS
jgi:hypothetical protein